MARRELRSWKIRGKGEKKSKYKKAKRWYKDLQGRWSSLAGHCCSLPATFCCPHQWCCKFFIPFSTFFIFVPGKDRVLMRRIFVLLLKSHVFQLTVAHLLSRQAVLSSIQPLLYHNLPNEVSFSPALLRPSRHNCAVAGGTAGHPSRGARSCCCTPRKPLTSANMCNNSCWLPNSLIFVSSFTDLAFKF